MAGSTSQASTLVPRGAGARSAVGGSAPPSTGVRRTAGRSAASGRGGGKLSQNVMNFYTDDSPGLKISPVIVISMSIGFIIFVTFLHIVGKVRGV